MNIEIKRKITDELLKSYKMIFDLQMKNAYRWAIILSIAGVFFMLWGIYDKDNSAVSLDSFSIFVSVYLFYNIYKTRKAYLSIPKKLIENSTENNNEITITILDDLFTYETFERKLHYKWSAFSNYKLVKDILFLFIGDNYLSAFTVHENELTKQELLEFYNFLAKNLSEKK